MAGHVGLVRATRSALVAIGRAALVACGPARRHRGRTAVAVTLPRLARIAIVSVYHASLIPRYEWLPAFLTTHVERLTREGSRMPAFSVCVCRQLSGRALWNLIILTITSPFGMTKWNDKTTLVGKEERGHNHAVHAVLDAIARRAVNRALRLHAKPSCAALGSVVSRCGGRSHKGCRGHNT